MRIQWEQNEAESAARAITEALPVLPGRWKRSRISVFGVKSILVLLTVLIGMPSPRVWACACTEVVGGSGAVSSDLSVDDQSGSITLLQSDISEPGVIPLELTRTYQSDNTVFGIFGPGWVANTANNLEITLGNIQVNFNGGVETFSASDGYSNDKKTMTLSFTAPEEITVMQRADGAQWVFNASDKTLKNYIDRNGNQVSYTWKIVPKNSLNFSKDGVVVQALVYCPLTVTYPDGRMLTFTYDTSGDYQYLCRQVTGPQGTVSYSYTDGLLTGVNMGGGQVLNYAYHKITDNAKTLGWLTKISYANAAEVNINYNGQYGTSNPLRATSVTGPLGYNHTYAYTGTSSLMTVTQMDSLNRSTTYTYEANTNSEKFPNLWITGALQSSVYTVNNAQNQPLSITNSKGKSILLAYDNENTDPLARNNLVSQTNPLGKTWAYAWDSNYNKTKITNPSGHEANFTYDVKHNLLTTKNGLNQTVVSNTYTSQGRLATVTGGRNNTASITYNTNGFPTNINDEAGKDWTMTYDGSGNLLTSTSPIGNTASRTYNSFKKVAIEMDALANTKSFTYDEMANLTSVTDANLNVKNYSWDQWQRPTSITDALSNTTTFAYDAEGNLTMLTDPLNHAYGYMYDGANNLKSFRFPNGSEESYEYDENRNVVKKTDTAGQQISYAYDDADRLTTKALGDGTIFTNSYDDDNHLIGITRTKNSVTESSLSYTLNTANQVTSLVTDGRTIGYGYDSGQNISQVTYPSGTVVNYDYDNCDRLSNIKGANNSPIASYTMDDAGRITKRTYPNGLETVYSYDAADRKTMIALRQSATPENVIQSFAYGYDAAGNRLWVQHKDGTGDVYKYDAAYQLVGVKYGVSNPQSGYDAATDATRVVTYIYDAMGNRTSVTDDGNSDTYTTNNLNQYTAVSGTNYTYSMRGDLTGDGTWTYICDYEGHLISASKAGTTVTYKYDTQGRRIEKDINGVAAAKYVYSGFDLIEERSGTGSTVTASYVYAGGIDQPVKVIKGSSTYYFQQDALGNVTSLTDSTGSIVEQYSYDVYGKPTIKNGSGTIKTTPLTPFLFTGREYDSETGLYNYRARAYSPALGRFISRDPIGVRGGLNLYAYVENSPINWVDPDGLMTFRWGNGNWEGPGWASGQYRPESGPGPLPQPGDPGYLPPKGEEDACAEKHDNCINKCPTCPKSANSACVRGCDRAFHLCLNNMKHKTIGSRLVSEAFRWFIPTFIH